jgi:nucleoside-diphosphate-sugar epimerase
MPVFVTGAAGFIGFHLVEALIRRGGEGVGLDNLFCGRVETLATVFGASNFHM